jgi:L,D-transpeptidase catalytic domain
MIRVGGHRAASAARLWRIAVLTAACAVGAASQADAALYYWSDSEPGYSQARPAFPHRRQQRARRGQAKKIATPEKELAKPQGPLIIAISIDRQNLRIYDANGFFAETPISTGMKGHPTPMGVFSIIQKHKLHHSNIYSGAPMPFMQRITWSGVAMHAGVLPGYPASHGCIRMPLAFATRMWNWTKMGARVVVTPGEMTPADFAHPLLVAQKVAPQPAAEPQADVPQATKSDKASDAGATGKPSVFEMNLELRSTIGHSDAKPVADEPSASRDLTRTADARNDMPAANALVTMTDAASSAGNAAAREVPSAPTDSASPAIAEDATPTIAEDKAGDPPKVDTTSAVAKASKSEPEAARPAETASTDDRPVEAKPQENADAGVKSAATDTTDKPVSTRDEAAVSTPASSETQKVEAAVETAKVEDTADATKLEAKADDVKAEPAKPDAPIASAKPDQSVTAATDARPSAVEVKKDQTRLPDTAKPATAKPEPAMVTAPKRTGQISVLISRKDSKLYVRQNFAPLFDVPVKIAPSERPLGTHVFTARVDKDDANILHWSVVTLPAPSRYAERRDEDARATRRRKIAGAVEMKPAPAPLPDSPAEALDRLTIPADAMARITESLTSGGSIIVSDQGINAGETGEGTDFIVSLR